MSVVRELGVRWLAAAAAGGLVLGAACAGDAPGPARDVPGADTAGDPASGDPAAEEPAAETAMYLMDPDAVLVIDPGTTAADGTLDARGFRIRVPGQRTVAEEGPGGETGTTEAWDQDWVCTLRHGGVDAFLYARFRPLKDKGWYFGGVVYGSEGAWVSSGGVVTPVAALYDSGGNHLNDWMMVAFQGTLFQYYHSSFSGPAWRKCQPMDCMQVLSDDGVSLVEDGCTDDRTLPQVCVTVAHDGTVPDLVDTFKPCTQ